MVRVRHHSELDDHSDVCQCYNLLLEQWRLKKKKERRTSKHHYTNLPSEVVTRKDCQDIKKHDKCIYDIHNQSSRPQEQHKAYHHSEHIVSYLGC